jgi:hypothetical protein
MKNIFILCALITSSCAHGGSNFLDRIGVPQARWDRSCQEVTCTTTGAGSVIILAENGSQACNWSCAFYEGGFHHVRAEFTVNVVGCFEEPTVTVTACH